MSVDTRFCPLISKFQNGTERIEDNEFVTWPHFVGNSILIFGRRSDRFPYHCFVGPDWPCMLCTYALVIVPTIFFIYDVGTVIGWWVILVGTLTGFSVLM
jgi:hypothetical protein